MLITSPRITPCVQPSNFGQPSIMQPLHFPIGHSIILELEVIHRYTRQAKLLLLVGLRVKVESAKVSLPLYEIIIRDQ